MFRLVFVSAQDWKQLLDDFMAYPLNFHQADGWAKLTLTDVWGGTRESCREAVSMDSSLYNMPTVSIHGRVRYHENTLRLSPVFLGHVW